VQSVTRSQHACKQRVHPPSEPGSSCSVSGAWGRCFWGQLPPEHTRIRVPDGTSAALGVMSIWALEDLTPFDTVTLRVCTLSTPSSREAGKLQVAPAAMLLLAWACRGRWREREALIGVRVRRDLPGARYVYAGQVCRQ
jgi:hypothetical protein